MKAKSQDSVSNRWPTVRLGDVCDFRRGLTYSKSDEVDSSNNVVLRSNNVDLEKSALVLSELKFINDAVEIPEDKKVVAGSILMCMANGSKSHLGKVAMIEQNLGYAFGGFMGLLVPTDNIFPKYLFSILISPRFKNLINSLMDGANINNLKFKDIADYQFPLPPLAEQRKIVAKLEKELERVEAIKAKFERMESAAKNLFKAALTEEFENASKNIVSLESICEPIKDGTHQTPTYSDKEHGVIFLSSKDVATGKIDWDHVKYIDPILHTELHKRVAPREGDILLAKNGTTGIAAIVDRDAVFDIYVTLALLRVRSSCNNKYLWYAVNSPIAKEQFNKRLKGMGVPNLHLVEIRQVQIPLPPLAAQREIVARLDAIKARSEGITAKAREAVATCEKLRKAILAEAFQ